MLEQVRYDGACPTREKAEEAVRLRQLPSGYALLFGHAELTRA